MGNLGFFSKGARMPRLKRRIKGILCVLLGLWIMMPIGAGAQEEQKPTGEPNQKKAEEKPLPTEDRREEAAKERAETILIQEGGVLIPKKTLVIEPSFNYTHFSRNLISISGFTVFEAIVIGTIAVEDIDRDILTPSLSFLYGITDRLQFALEIPYLYRHDRLVPTAETGVTQRDRTIEANDFGDIEAGLFAHVSQARGWRPDVILNFRWKTRTGEDPYGLDTEEIEGKVILKELPTGSGHDGLSGGFTLVKAADPVVFFGTGSYFWNIERHVGGNFGEVDPGDSVEYVLGMATALSERISLSLSFQNVITGDTTQDGSSIPGSETNAASAFLGTSYRISKDVSVFASVGLGLTEDSPDFQVEIRVPISFSLF